MANDKRTVRPHKEPYLTLSLTMLIGSFLHFANGPLLHLPHLVALAMDTATLLAFAYCVALAFRRG